MTKKKKEKEIDTEKLLIQHMIQGHARAEQERLRELKEKLHVYIVHFGGTRMVFVAPSHGAVVEHVTEMGYAGDEGPIDLGERIWELPAGGYKLDQVTLICSGDKSIEEKVLARREAQKNAGAGCR